jgi:hypothetical protein
MGENGAELPFGTSAFLWTGKSLQSRAEVSTQALLWRREFS